MALKAGTTGDLDNSLAQAIETAFKAEWNNVMKKKDGSIPPAPEFTDQTRLIFLAVAQGVVNHISGHPEAFKIKIDAADPGTGIHTHTASISSIDKS